MTTLFIALLSLYSGLAQAQPMKFETRGNNTLGATVACTGDSLNIDSGTGYFDCLNNRYGVANTSPQYPLDVTGDIRGTSQLVLAGTATVQGNAFSVGSSSFVVTASSIGIRTNSPIYALDISGDVRATGIGIFASSLTVISGGFISQGTVGNVAIVSGGNQITLSRGGANYITATNASGALSLGSAGNTNILDLNTDGSTVINGIFDVGPSTLVVKNARVGIGTTSPGAVLDVKGTISLGTTGTPLAAISTGTWTPTCTSITNVDACTPSAAIYTRIGNLVLFVGEVAIDPTSAADTATEIELSLPIASDFTTGIDASGIAATSSAQRAARIASDSTNDRLEINFASEVTGNTSFRYSGTYVIK